MIKPTAFRNLIEFFLLLLVSLLLALSTAWFVKLQGTAAAHEILTINNDQFAHMDRLTYNEIDRPIHAISSNHTPQITIYYVSKDGDNSAPTEGFDTGFKYLWDAIAFVGLSGGGEIWVAAGVYYPDEGGSVTDNDPSETFFLADTIQLYGGFDNNDKKFSDRDWENNLTVLSGDIDKNDMKDWRGVVNDPSKIRGANAYHVVTAPGGTINGELDGFTITAGQANGSLFPDFHGGGFFCDGGGDGKECHPDLRNVTFIGNLAENNGGAMYNDGSFGGSSSPSLINVIFSKNEADQRGGAMSNNGGGSGISSPTLSKVTFSNNTAGARGGAMYNDANGGTTSPRMNGVIFLGNRSNANGGAIFNYGANGTCSPNLINVTLSGNKSDASGGAIYNNRCSPNLTNVSISGNIAGYLGGGIHSLGSGGTYVTDLRNSIVWNNQDTNGLGTLDANISNDNAITILANSLVQGAGTSGSDWTAGTGFYDGDNNIDINPLFVDPVNPSDSPTSAGNLRLQVGSPAIDAGENSYISSTLTDLDGEPRKVDGDLNGKATVDMGAYERAELYIHTDGYPMITCAKSSYL